MNATRHVIIVGSGAGGAAAAYTLANAGIHVTLIEKGTELPRDASTLDVEQVVHRAAFKSREVWRDGAGKQLTPEEYFNVGGKTKWYGAALLRFARHEFWADPLHGCLAWPIGYDDLEPYYSQAERLLGVRHFAIEPNLEHLCSRLERRAPEWQRAALPLGLDATILGNRLEATRFDGFASVANLKSDAETIFLSAIRRRPHVTLLTGSPVTDLIGDPVDRRRIIGVRLHDGRVLRADAVVLGAGALHSPRLVRRYLEATGLYHELPSARLVGRNLKLHLLTAVVAISPSIKTDLIRKTTLLLNDRLQHSSVQPLGFDGGLIGTLVPRLVPRVMARLIGQRAYGFFLQTEDGSHLDNAVTEHGTQAILDYDARRSPAAAREHDTLVKSFRGALLTAGMLAFSKRIGVEGTAHACGTLVAGKGSLHSVVDDHGRVHDLQSLYVVDGSVLPRSSRVNPSLTIYAFSLRAAQALAARLQARTSNEVPVKREVSA